MVYNLSAKSSYLKSEIVEIGRFGPFLVFFLDSARYCPYAWEVELNDCALSGGRGLRKKLLIILILILININYEFI